MFSASVRASSMMAPKTFSSMSIRYMSTKPRVAVVGAAGGIGQPLALLLKASPLVGELSLYDIAPVTPGVGADLSHINTGAKVEAFAGAEALGESLKGADVVVVPAGVPRKPGMTRDDLFNINAGIVAGIAKAAGENCPNASILIISNPVNSTVPICAEVLKSMGVYNPKKLYGVTHLDVTRANTFVAENQGMNVDDLNVTVVGGHAGKTILPILSGVPNSNYSQEDKEALTHRIMFGGDEVVKAKAGGGSATLSMAYAGAGFTELVLKGMRGDEGVVGCAYVESDKTEAAYFATPVSIGTDGITKVHDIPELDDFEKEKLGEMMPELKDQIQKGVDFVKNM